MRIAVLTRGYGNDPAWPSEVSGAFGATGATGIALVEGVTPFAA